MAGGESAAGSISLENTPTWAIATFCFLIVSISIMLEHIFQLLSNWLKRRRKTALYNAVGRLKSVADTMLPCRKQPHSTQSLTAYTHLNKLYARMLVEADAPINNANVTDSCTSKGKVSLVTEKGVQQLQHFILVLAVMQIVYSVLTMALGRAKMSRWKAWEKETQTTDYQVANDPNRFRFIRQTTFGRRHNTCTDTTVQLWIKCFFRQFFHSVAKVDYFTLRHGFITAHLSSRHTSFNFQKYIERSLDEDFSVVVSISPFMWFLVVIFMLVDVHGWHSYLWISYVPLLIVLVLGTKLEVIVTKMALQLQDKNNVIIGVPLVKPNDNLFWLRRPRFVLNLLHLTLFVMGSEFRGEIVKEKTARLLKQWHAQVRDKVRKQQQEMQPTIMPTSDHSYAPQPNNVSPIITEITEEQISSDASKLETP